MLCSNCNEVVKPVVAIDIDGTLANYHWHFNMFAAEWLGRPLRGGTRQHWMAYDGSEPHRDYVMREWEVDVTTFRMIKLAYRQGGMKRTQPVYQGAMELTAYLRLIGAEVWLTTTRPHDRFDRVDPDTREWLRRAGIEFDGLLYHDDKMSELADRVGPGRVCFVMDDQEDILLEAASLFGQAAVVLRRTTYNRGVKWPVVVEDLGAAQLKAEAHVRLWKERYAKYANDR